MPDDTTPAAGWYPDPHGSAAHRWWDGQQWTSATSEAGEHAPAADTAGATTASASEVGSAPSSAPEAVAQPPARPWHHKKRFVLPLGVLIGLVLGVAVNGGGQDDEIEVSADADDELQEIIDELEAQTEALQQELAAAEDAAAAEPTDDAEPSEEDAADSDEVAAGHAVGETVAMGDLEHTLHAARWEEGEEFNEPDDGERWLVLDIELDNVGSDSAAVSSLGMWDLVDHENRTKDIALNLETSGSLDGELGAGRQMRGEVTFSVADDETEWELIFSPNVFGFGQAIYDIDDDEVD